MFIDREIGKPRRRLAGRMMEPTGTIKIRSAPPNGAGRKGCGGHYRHLTPTE